MACWAIWEVLLVKAKNDGSGASQALAIFIATRTEISTLKWAYNTCVGPCLGNVHLVGKEEAA